jgi:murein DD-endopeptidase MepM/ murein hydrolase activator NlpD
MPKLLLLSVLLVLLSGVVLGAGLPVPVAQAAGQTTAAQAEAKAKPKAKAKAQTKAKAKTQSKVKAPVASKSKAVAKRSKKASAKAPSKPRIATVPLPASLGHKRQITSLAAQQPLSGSQRVVSLRQGCMGLNIGELPVDVAVAPPVGAALAEGPVDAVPSSPCQHYAYAINANGAVSVFAMVRPDSPGDVPDAPLVETVAPALDDVMEVVPHNGPTLADASHVRIIDIDPQLLEDPPAEGLFAFTPGQAGELDTLLPQLRVGVSVPDALQLLRVAVRVDDNERIVQLLSVSLLDAEREQLLERAVFLEREDMPAGWFSGRDGRGLQREFWISPVAYTRISRGVSEAKSKTVKGRAISKGGRVVRAAPRIIRSRAHTGVDYAASRGTPVHCVAAGTVVFAGRHAAYGNLVIVEHLGGFTSYYGHLDRFADGLQQGSVLGREEQLGVVGSTGRATGPHLHFEIRHDGNYLDVLEEPRNSSLWSLRGGDWVDFMTRVVFAQWIADRP